MRYQRVERLLSAELSFRKKMGAKTEAVVKPNGDRFHFSPEVIAVTEAVHAAGHDAHTLAKHEVIRIAIPIFDKGVNGKSIKPAVAAPVKQAKVETPKADKPKAVKPAPKQAPAPKPKPKPAPPKPQPKKAAVKPKKGSAAQATVKPAPQDKKPAPASAKVEAPAPVPEAAPESEPEPAPPQPPAPVAAAPVQQAAPPSWKEEPAPIVRAAPEPVPVPAPVLAAPEPAPVEETQEQALQADDSAQESLESLAPVTSRKFDEAAYNPYISMYSLTLSLLQASDFYDKAPGHEERMKMLEKLSDQYHQFVRTRPKNAPSAKKV